MCRPLKVDKEEAGSQGNASRSSSASGFGSPYTLVSFSKALVFHSCTAALAALDLSNPSASWETAPSLCWDVPGPCSLQRSPSSYTWRSPSPACSLRSSTSPVSVCAGGPEPDLPQLDGSYESLTCLDSRCFGQSSRAHLGH